jgi:hypothetical protein
VRMRLWWKMTNLTVSEYDVRRFALMARRHADALSADIANASNRIEHIRITRLALEAEQIAKELESLVPTPTASAADSTDGTDVPLFTPTHY